MSKFFISSAVVKNIAAEMLQQSQYINDNWHFKVAVADERVFDTLIEQIKNASNELMKATVQAVDGEVLEEETLWRVEKAMISYMSTMDALRSFGVKAKIEVLSHLQKVYAMMPKELLTFSTMRALVAKISPASARL